MPRLSIEAEGSAFGAGATEQLSPGPWPGPSTGQPPEPSHRNRKQTLRSNWFRNRRSSGACGTCIRRTCLPATPTTGRRYSLWHFGSQQVFSQQAVAHLLAASRRTASLLTASGFAAVLHAAAFLATSRLGTAAASLLAAGRLRTATASLAASGFGAAALAACSSNRVRSSSPSPRRLPSSCRTSHAPGSAGTLAANFCSRPVCEQPQAFSQQAGFAQQPQAFSQQAGFAQHAGSGQQAFAQQAFSQQPTLAQALHSPQPPPFSPSMRSRSSKLNPWLHRATLTRTPKNRLALIEQPLLYSELGLGKVGRNPQFIRCTAGAVEPFLGSIPT